MADFEHFGGNRSKSDIWGRFRMIFSKPTKTKNLKVPPLKTLETLQKPLKTPLNTCQKPCQNNLKTLNILEGNLDFNIYILIRIIQLQKHIYVKIILVIYQLLI